ncbi:MAG: hypothetical protein KAH38_11375, partial [Candidatus Hydrogenedentes bacterium]|nr:hypothetical protein [Candidatus Hydrogenedentota bacterium]
MSKKKIFIVVVLLLLSSIGYADALDDLDRGHRLIIEHGLQLQALVLDNITFDVQIWADSNYTTVNFWAIPNVSLLGTAPGISWSRWFGGHDVIVNMDLPPEEMFYLSTLISMQAGDEQDLTDPTIVQNTIDIYAHWRRHYPAQIHMLSQMLKNMANLEPHIDDIQPDLIAGGSYRLNIIENYLFEPIRRGGSPQKMYKELLMLRNLCLQGHAGSNGNPIPYGIFTQLFYQPSDGDYKRIVSESQMRLQMMASLAFGCKWICAFIYNNKFKGSVPNGELYPVLFGEGGDWTEPTERFYQSSQLNAEVRNFAPALVRLVSSDVRIVSGKYRNPFSSLLSWLLNILLLITRNHHEISQQPPLLLFGAWAKTIPLAEGMKHWTADADPYITSISQTNLGSTNDGLPGDLLVGYSHPLHEDFDGFSYNNEIYFMIVNSMAFQNATSLETSQRIEVRFDFSGTGITSLQRLERSTGQVEEVFLKDEGNHQYLLEMVYGGVRFTPKLV